MEASDSISWRDRIASGVENLFPGYFALVMATGIVSIAAELLGMESFAVVLLGFNLAAYALLSLLLVARVALYPRRVLQDFCDHERGAGFFTVVAGTCMLGSQVLIVAEETSVARALWALGIALWVLVMYGFFAAIIVRKHKPSLQVGINGAWLLAIVATQGVSVLGALLAPTMANREPVLFLALCMYLLGAMLYLTIITLIFYRFTFFEMTREGLTPLYWINMGAVAISTLAGSILLQSAESWPFLELLSPFLTGFTLFFWVTATWWIPLLVILGIWRHVIGRFPFRYDPQYWGMIFPLGMYAACTLRLAQAAELEFLLVIPSYFIYVAVVAWCATFAAMAYSLSRSMAAPAVH